MNEPDFFRSQTAAEDAELGGRRAPRPRPAGAPDSPTMPTDRPSPFTVPEPTFRFPTIQEKDPAAPRRTLTVGDLVRELVRFAGLYEEATEAAAREAATSPGTWRATGRRDQYTAMYLKQFRETDGIDRVRSFVMTRCAEGLTVRTAGWLLVDLIRSTNMSLEAAEATSLQDAMDRLDGVPADQPPPPPPPRIDETDFAILWALGDAPCTLQNASLAAAVNELLSADPADPKEIVSVDTVKKRVQSLVEAGLASRPLGDAKGAAITPTGRAAIGGARPPRRAR